jgi:hypothetical protein
LSRALPRLRCSELDSLHRDRGRLSGDATEGEAVQVGVTPPVVRLIELLVFGSVFVTAEVDVDVKVYVCVCVVWWWWNLVVVVGMRHWSRRRAGAANTNYSCADCEDNKEYGEEEC